MATDSLAKLSVAQLRQALALKQQIEALERELRQRLDAPTPATPRARARRTRTPSVRAAAKKAPRKLARLAVPAPLTLSSPSGSPGQEAESNSETGRCRFCGHQAIPGGDVCLSCDDAR